MNVAVLGAGPHGHEIAEVAFALGLPVWFYDDDPDMPDIHGLCSLAKVPAYLGAAWPQVRRQLTRWPAPAGAPLVHPDATVSHDSDLAAGVVVWAGARVGHDVVIGRHTHLNLNATVSRGCRVGELVNVAPGANIAGGVIVEDDVFIGVGAVITHELVVGEGALIGAGAVVVEDVKPHTRVAGCPARPIGDQP